jgi:ABC-2 type transport system permease protein
MTTVSHFAADSGTLLHRNLLHMLRYPALTYFVVGGPVVFLFLFVFVFGGALGAGLPDAGGSDRAAYLAFVVPGILLTAAAGTAGGTAITVSMDMTEGITARFRTMAISRAAVLTGHVVGNVIQGLIAVALVLVVAVLIGFRPTASPIEWLAALGVTTLILTAITWLSVAMGMSAKSVESASNLPTLLVLLPFLGSGFVPTDTMPAAVQAFADYQPFTPFIDTIRGLLLGTPIGLSWVWALAWCLAISAVGFVWSMRLYHRRSVV